MKLFYRSNGAVTIFLIIILVPMLALTSLFVDTSKIKLARGVAESAGELTLNTALTEYDILLKDMYGLMATSQNTEEFYELLEDYYKTCITSSGVSEDKAAGIVDQYMDLLHKVEEDGEVSDVLNMELVNFDVSKADSANLANAALLKKQVVEFMKYRAPINTGVKFLESLKSFSTLGKQTELVDKRKKYYEEESNLMKKLKDAWDNIAKYEGKVPDDKDNAYRKICNDGYLEGMKSDIGSYKDKYADIAVKIADIMETEKVYKELDKLAVKFEYKKSFGSKKKLYILYDTKNALVNDGDVLDSDFDSAVERFIKEDGQEKEGAYYDEVEKRKELEKLSGDDIAVYKAAYEDWINSVIEMNRAYCSVMIAGEEENKTSSSGYGNVKGKFNNYAKANGDFYRYREKFLKKINSESNSSEKTALDNEIKGYCSKINEYYSELEKSIDKLDKAISILNGAIGCIDKVNAAKDKWKGCANDGDISDTSLAEQDRDEIEKRKLDENLTKENINKLIKLLEEIKEHLEKAKDGIKGYEFFENKIIDIEDYDDLRGIMEKDGIEGKTDKSFFLGKFSYGDYLGKGWPNVTKWQTLKENPSKPRFYSYLYGLFGYDYNVKENKENGENFYKKINKVSDNNKNEEAGVSKEGSKEENTKPQLIDEVNIMENCYPSKDIKDNGNDDKMEGLEEKGDKLNKMFGGLLDKIGDGIDDFRDKLYVSDYILSMFSYDTIEGEVREKKGKGSTPESLTHNKFSEKTQFAYKNEVEYIIYGGKYGDNKVKSYATIYAIRLAFNLIYAFSDAEIRNSALAIATPISAATLGVIPAPLIQAAIIIGLACVESGIDLLMLKEGKAVPLYKTKDSWVCSTSGVINRIKNETKDAAKKWAESEANKVVDDVVNKLSDCIDNVDISTDEAIEDFEKSVGDMYDAMITGPIDEVSGRMFSLIKEKIDSGEKNIRSSVKIELEDWVNSETDSSGMSYKIKKATVDVIINEGILDEYIKLMRDNAGVDEMLEKAEGFIKEKNKGLRDKVIAKLETAGEKITDKKKELINAAKESMNEGSDKFKETLNNKIDEIFGPSSGKGGDNPDAKTKGVASVLSFYYSDYLRLFLFVGLYTNEEKILLRMGDVIQANMKHNSGDASYLLKNAAVYVNLDATIEVKPTFIALPLFSDIIEKDPTADKGWYTIKYKSIAGY